MKKVLLLYLALPIVIGCQADDNIPVIPNSEPVTVQMQHVYKHNHANNPEAAGHYVFNDEASWSTFVEDIDSPYSYNQSTGTSNKVLLDIETDFLQYTYIAVVDVEHEYGGYAIEVTSVVQERNSVVATVETSELGAGSATTVLTQPYHIIRIPKTDLPVTFQ